MLYRWRTGANAWLIHRISGVVVGAYLLLHILDRFGSKYDLKCLAGLGDFLSSKALVVILLALLIYHSLNGVRELIIDFGSGALYYKKVFWVMMLIGVVVYVAALTAL
jgi:succinate dehydrogenase / fumarate reductase, cytochrome b subunit